MNKFEYTYLTVKVTGAKTGILSGFFDKGIDNDNFVQLKTLGRAGWKLISVIPITHGAVGSLATDAAICFLIRETGLLPTSTNHPQSEKRKDKSKGDTISASDFSILLERRALVARIGRDINYAITDTDWEFITNNSVPEALRIIESTGHFNNIATYDKLLRYYRFLVYDYANLAIQSLYQMLRVEGTSSTALRLIKDLQLFDQNAISELLRHSNHKIRRIALDICFAQKPSYTIADLELFRTLRDQVVKAFPKANITEKGGLFGKKRIWQCINCRTADNLEERPLCACGADMHGILYTTGTFNEALSHFDDHIDILSEEFAD